MSRNSEAIMYVVVEVMAGVAVDARCFETAKDATAYERKVRARRKPDQDDVQVFERALNAYPEV